MSTIRAALVAAVVVLGGNASHAAEPLSLERAFERTILSHPDLAVLRLTADGLAAERDRVSLRPALAIGASIENVLGSGAAAGVDGAELTLSLASLLERGGKREARIAVVDARLHATDLLRVGQQLDLLAEVARRYLDLLAAQSGALFLRDELARRETIVEATKRRFEAGAIPESIPMAAEAARLRTLGEVERAQRAERLAARRLALSWGDAEPDFSVAEGNLGTMPVVPDYVDLTRRLAHAPELQRFAHEARLREARLQLARTARSPDLQWELGVRRLPTDRDWGLVGSVSIPLGSVARARPEIRAADAELSALQFERDAQARTLMATLADAWGRLDEAVATARAIDERLLPQLQRADAAAERAWRAGAISYLDWAQLQSEISAARRERLDAGLAAHRARIELQRLTGESFGFAAAHQESTP
jgi:cobalt-zinc-cadmium efflux system outer membrane protein